MDKPIKWHKNEIGELVADLENGTATVAKMAPHPITGRPRWHYCYHQTGSDVNQCGETRTRTEAKLFVKILSS